LLFFQDCDKNKKKNQDYGEFLFCVIEIIY